LPLSTDTITSNQNESPSHSKVPVPILTVRTDDVTAVEEQERNSPYNKLVDTHSLRRVCSSSKIPVSKRRLNTEIQKRNLVSLSTERCFQRQPTSSREASQKCFEKNTSNKYSHIKSKVAAYIHHHRSAKTDFVTRSNTTRSMSPIDSKSRDEANTSEGGIKGMSSRTSLETYPCEYKMV